MAIRKGTFEIKIWRMSSHRQEPQISKHKLSCEVEGNLNSYTNWDRWANSGWLNFFSSKITADGDCSHDVKRCLLLGRKAMTNLDSILKSRDITLLTKVRLVKAMVFPVVMYRCESWPEHRRIDAFELWYWRRLLRVPWTARKSNQSILREIGPGCSLEGLMLKLKLQYFGHLIKDLTHLKRPWCWERLKAREVDDRGWDGCWHHWLNGQYFG